MSRIYLRVIVTNDSSATLRLRQHWTSGEWTPGGWAPTRFPQTTPGGSLHWQAEGDTLAGATFWSGVEARTWYDVVDARGTVVGEFYIFANSPLVESQYGTTFHVRAPSGHYAAYVDARGQRRDGRAVLEISFRDTRKVAVPGFTPSRNGFRFGNSWNRDLPVVTVGALWNSLRDGMGDLADVLGIGRLPDDLLPITHAGAGLCGGMTYAAIDYFHTQQLPPPPDLDAGGLPVSPASAEHPLFQHIRRRLLNSFDFTGRGHRWLSYSSPLYPDGDEGVTQAAGLMKGRAWVTYREEWPRIRELLDQGRLVPLGLVQSTDFDIGANHQVLAYAYRQSGQVVQLWVYDPNVPADTPAPAKADDLYLEFDITDTTHGITVTRHNCRDKDHEKKIYAILHMDNYLPRTPPAGRPLSTRPKSAAITSSAETVTAGGTVTRRWTNHCGDVIQFGEWICRTTEVFAVQALAFADPSVVWQVDGTTVAAGTTAVTVVRDGRRFEMGCRIGPGGRTLTLSSGPGDTYEVPVRAEVTDPDGEKHIAEGTFAVDGDHSGMRLEDLGTQARCIARTIPRPVDLERFTAPRPLEEPDWNARSWQREALAGLRADESLDVNLQQAIRGYIQLQVEVPEFRLGARNLRAIRRQRPTG